MLLAMCSNVVRQRLFNMKYAYENLGDEQFETLLIFLCQKLLGISVQGFSKGPDAVLPVSEGKASSSVRHHRTGASVLGPECARATRLFSPYAPGKLGRIPLSSSCCGRSGRVAEGSSFRCYCRQCDLYPYPACRTAYNAHRRVPSRPCEQTAAFYALSLDTVMDYSRLGDR